MSLVIDKAYLAWKKAAGALASYSLKKDIDLDKMNYLANEEMAANNILRFLSNDPYIYCLKLPICI